MSEEDVRPEYLSRFDSSTVSMLNEEALLAIGPDGKKEFLEKKGRRESRAVQRSMSCTHLVSTPSKSRSLSPSSTLNVHFPLIGASRTIRAAEHSGHFYFRVNDPYYRGFNRTHTRFRTHVFSHQTLHSAFIHSNSLTRTV